MLFVAGEVAFTVDQAVDRLQLYGRTYPSTIRYYDLGGTDEVDLRDDVSTADLGRLVLINARLNGADAAKLLNFDLRVALAELPVDLRLTEVHIDGTSTDPRYRAMETTWATLTTHHGIGRAKASKLLHLKRPKLFPIFDSGIRAAYKGAATAVGARLGLAHPHFWAAISTDVAANAGSFEEIRDRLRREDDYRSMAHLTDLRLQDILSWSPKSAQLT